MRKIEQKKEDMQEIYSKVIYPGMSYAALIELESLKLDALKSSVVANVSNKELNVVFSAEINRIVKELKQVSEALTKNMGDALISFAPMEFIREIQKKN